MDADPDGAAPDAPFGRLDYIYAPSSDVLVDRDHLVKVLRGRSIFAIEDAGTRVAAVRLTDGPPLVLLTDHLEGDRPILVYQVDDLRATLERLQAAGWESQRSFEIPQGPCSSFRTPGGQRLALYELTRPGVEAHFEGRHDF